MRLGSFTEVTVSSASEATRRLVDLSLVLDVSGSIGPAWPAVRDAARSFIDAFDKNGDRMALITYSYGAKVLDPMPAGFGFDKDKLKADVPNALPGGTTSMAEGLYRGWDELRSVANGQQAGLRVIVLFTDGSGNVFPGFVDGSGVAKGVFSGDFPKVLPDPTNATTNTPSIQGAFDTQTGLLVRRYRESKTVLGPFPLQMDFEDYQVVDGVKIPLTLRWSMPGRVWGRRIAEVKHNVPIEDEQFNPPRR